MAYNTLEEKQGGYEGSTKWVKNWFQVLSRQKCIYTFITCVGFVPCIHCAAMPLQNVLWSQLVSAYSEISISLFSPSCFRLISFLPCHLLSHYLPPKHFNWQFIIISVYLFKLTGIQIAVNRGICVCYWYLFS